MSKDAFDRRSFLKGAAASAAAVLGTQLAANAPAEGAQSNSESGEKPATRDKIIGRPGSDYMVDVIKATGNRQTEAEGAAEKTVGKVQKGFGDVKEKVKRAL